MRHFEFIPHGVCARAIHIDLSDDGTLIEGVSFEGGCNGNLKAIGKLVEGHNVSEVVDILSGNTCGVRLTSCADQLSHALLAAQQQVAAA